MKALKRWRGYSWSRDKEPILSIDQSETKWDLEGELENSIVYMKHFVETHGDGGYIEQAFEIEGDLY